MRYLEYRFFSSEPHTAHTRPDTKQIRGIMEEMRSVSAVLSDIGMM